MTGRTEPPVGAGDGRPPALTSTGMAAVFSWGASVARMCEFEAALAGALADAGLCSRGDADAVEAACRPEDLDLHELARLASGAATPAIPLVAALSARLDGGAAAVLHRGATSQDVIDTALVLQMRAGLDRLLADLVAIGDRCAELASAHRDTVMVGRTLLQQALPTTFGLKVAHWLATTMRHLNRLRDLREGLPVQLGGAVGTLAPYHDRGPVVVEALAERLGLAAPLLPWHTDRDLPGAVVDAVAASAASLGKAAIDVILLMQSEVGELHDPGAGGSSTMPHKHNPVDAVLATASSRLCIAAAGAFRQAGLQEHERAAGGWQAEWAVLPEVFLHAGSTSARVASALRRIEVDAERMRANLVATGGLVMSEALSLALATELGRPAAHEITEQLATKVLREAMDLRAAAASDDRVTAILDESVLNAVLDPTAYLGSAQVFVDRALSAWDEVRR